MYSMEWNASGLVKLDSKCKLKVAEGTAALTTQLVVSPNGNWQFQLSAKVRTVSITSIT